MCRDHLRARGGAASRRIEGFSISRSTCGRDPDACAVGASFRVCPSVAAIIPPTKHIRSVMWSNHQTRASDVRACRLKITNFRGIQSATLLLPKHGVLIGDNNTGKTTIFEALDLVLG